ncbi:MAG: hypothetical protein IJ326_09490 [Lachnospiraceae bacterium]|nr:hypothetical protein [Lachnospiraceae bacterium]
MVLLKKINMETIKRHSAMTTIFVLQIAVIAVLFLYSCVSPRRVVEIEAQRFNVSADNVSIQDEKLVISEKDSVNADNKQSITTTEFGLTSGAYEISVPYDSQVGKGQITEYNADVSISSQFKIYTDSIRLNDQDNVLYGKIWIPILSNCDDLKLKISYNGSGPLEVGTITFTESVSYRFIRMVGFILLFAFVDIVIMALFTDIQLPINRVNVSLAAIVFVASIPFTAKVLFSGHDQWFHLLRISSLAAEIENGQLPVRMSTVMNNGYGYPNSIYYGDIFLYPSALLYLCGVPLRVCYQAYVIFINIATAVITYFTLGVVTRNVNLRLLGSAIYTLSMYRVINLNTRAAAGEYTAMAFLPLIIAGVFLIYTKEKPRFKDWVPLSVGMAGVIMSHVVTAEMLVINLALLCIVLLKKTMEKDKFMAFVKAVALCIGLTAWFIVPFIDYVTSQKTKVQEDDLRLLENNTQELIYLFRMFSPGNEGANYLTVGLSMILGIVIVVYCLVKYCKNNEENSWKLRVFAAFGLLNLLFVSKFFPWSRIQKYLDIEGLGYQIGTIQFSWRFLCIVSVVLTFAVVMALERISLENKKLYAYSCIAMLLCITLSVGFYYYRYPDEVSNRSRNIYQPYSNSDSLYLLEGASKTVRNAAKVNVMEGDAEISRYYKEDGVAYITVDNRGNQESVISAPIYAYKYYKVYDNEQEVASAVTDTKCISITVPADYCGEYQIRFEPPISWRISEIVSLIAAVGLICELIRRKHFVKK